MKQTLIIFAKEPTKGTVKTRLASCLSQDQRVELYKAFLRDAIDLAKKVKCQERILAYTSDKRPTYIRKAASKGFTLYRQRGKTLGDRMSDAFDLAKANGADKTIIIGSDTPTLVEHFVADGFQNLDQNDVVLGPAEDGGYYLIGLNNPCPGLFKSVEWSTGNVLRQTIDNTKKLKKRLALLDMWYDVDNEEDLACMIRYLSKDSSAESARWTRRA
ncbi:MAG: TIGR04282 family arsenosugar biosynthesis glycosyltransferase, partial [Candidatus Omnitrophota bacterium]